MAQGFFVPQLLHSEDLKMKTALITGITGQDGFHLAKLLLSKNYRVYGLVNGQRLDRSQELKLSLPRVEQLFGDLSDSSSILAAIQKTQPDEIYNLGAISFVGLSFTQPEHTANITGLSLLRILESVRALGLESKVRIYQASSSEMFGKVRESPQTELTPFHPRSPYGVAKVFAHYTATNYREAYGMHISCGILFNHEGEHRGNEFVTRKITQTVARIKLGLESELRLGSLTPRRDWGYAEDYVEAMWLMLQQEQPGDYVVATGETHTVREFVDLAFEFAGIEDGTEKYLIQDERFMRPSEVELLIGDATKARELLGWSPKTSFRQLVKIMIDNDLRLETAKSPQN
jgi:GDPmannose 4,6-dehydratase